jgi:hypothetical protein
MVSDGRPTAAASSLMRMAGPRCDGFSMAFFLTRKRLQGF